MRNDPVSLGSGSPTRNLSGSQHRARRTFGPRVLGPLLAAGLLTAACGDAGEAKVANAIPAHEALAPVVAQLAEYRASFDALVGACLEGEGFRSFPRTQDWHEADLTKYLEVPILALSVEDARGSGYSSLATAAGGSDEERDYYDSMTDAEARALYDAHFGGERIQVTSVGGFDVDLGVGGCAGQAATAVFGGAETWARVEGTLEDVKVATVRPMDEALASPEVQSALAAWSACMASAGGDYATPADARTAALATRAEGAIEPSAEEVAIAVSDATCQAQTELAATFTDRVLAHQQSAISDIERVFLAWDELGDEIDAAIK